MRTPEWLRVDYFLVAARVAGIITPRSVYHTLDLEEFVVFLEQYTMQEQALLN